MAMRSCGILMPIASLPSAYGIGCFDQAAYDFVDQLQKKNVKKKVPVRVRTGLSTVNCIRRVLLF